ncbi:MAG: hypothetical protein JXR34_10210 [Bacteroidales bacterium]|nr:hypothetical protein [Bacteroidales bacterium]
MRIRIILFSLLLFSYSVYSRKTTGLPTDNQQYKYDIKNYIQIFQTSQDIHPNDLFNENASFIQEGKQNDFSQGFSHNYFWIIFELENPAKKNRELYLEIDNPHIDTLEVYAWDSVRNTFQLMYQCGDRMKFHTRPINNRRFIFPIESVSNSSAKFAIMVDKRNASVSFPMMIWDRIYFDTEEKTNNLFYLLYFGGILFIAVFAFTIGLIMRNYRLIFYSFYAGLMGFYLFIALGFAFQYIYPDSDSLNNYIRSQVMILLLISFIAFTISYLNLKQNHSTGYKAQLIIAGILTSFFILSTVFRDFAFENIVLLLKAVYLLIFVSFPIILWSVVKIFKKIEFQPRIYLAAVSMLFIGVSIVNLIEFGIINEAFVPVNPILIGSILELFIFSISFIFEIKWINDKKNALLKAASEQQKELIKAFIQGSENEGNRISKELHDNIGSRLALLKNQLKRPTINSEKLNQDVSDIFSEIKNISNELSPNSLHILGLAKSTKSLIDTILIATELQINFYAEEILILNKHIELQVFRVIQEALHNIQKHSEAKTIDIQIIKEDSKLIVTIDDDGKGFDLSRQFTGKGIKNMKMRMDSVNGHFDLSSQINKGTHILISVNMDR